MRTEVLGGVLLFLLSCLSSGRPFLDHLSLPIHLAIHSFIYPCSSSLCLVYPLNLCLCRPVCYTICQSPSRPPSLLHLLSRFPFHGAHKPCLSYTPVPSPFYSSLLHFIPSFSPARPALIQAAEETVTRSSHCKEIRCDY